MSSLNLEDYETGTLPRYLWRVNDKGSQARLDGVTGKLVAKASSVAFKSELHFRRVLEDHLDWGCRNPSPFISVLSDWGHAKNFARQRPEYKFPVKIYKIDTNRLSEIAVLRLEDMISRLNIPEQGFYSSHEYLILGFIPSRAFVYKLEATEAEEREAHERDLEYRETLCVVRFEELRAQKTDLEACENMLNAHKRDLDDRKIVCEARFEELRAQETELEAHENALDAFENALDAFENTLDAFNTLYAQEKKLNARERDREDRERVCEARLDQLSDRLEKLGVH